MLFFLFIKQEISCQEYDLVMQTSIEYIHVIRASNLERRTKLEQLLKFFNLRC